MKISLNWLKEYVDFNWSPEELAERLTMLGVEVEGIDTKTGDFEGVIVAEILSSVQHPNADKLSVCKVADGKIERQIVCGAKNYKIGDKVPLALPGCTLPTPAGAPPFTIKVGKLRGVESQGMMCSPKELGLAEDDDIRSATFNPDGRWIATATEDSATVIWDASNGKRLIDLGKYQDVLTVVTFSADSSRIASGTARGQILLYPCGFCGSMEMLLTLAQTQVTRSLTAEEKTHYLAEGQ